jgi:hypothetical protein
MEPNMGRHKQAATPLPQNGYTGLASAAEQLLSALRHYETIGATREYARCMSLDQRLIAIRRPFLAAEEALHALGFSYRLYDRPHDKDDKVIPLDQDLKRGIDIVREVLYDIRGGGVSPTPPDPQDGRYVRPEGTPVRLSMETAARPTFVSEAGRLSVAVEMLRRAMPATPPRPQRRRHRQPPKQIHPLTARQLEVVQLFGEHEGNMTAVARAMGVSRQRAADLYQEAMAKLASKAPVKPKKQKLPEDHRGQAKVVDPSGPRRGRKYEDEE